MAHGLHLPAGRRRPDRPEAGGALSQLGARPRLRDRGTQRPRPGPAGAHDLRGRLRVPVGADDRRPGAEADHPLAEHGPLPRRPGGARVQKLPPPPPNRAPSRGGGAAIAESVSAELEPFWADLTAAYAEE